MIALFGSITFAVATVIYILLVLGFPFGEFALGGKYEILPVKFRIICAVSVLVQLFAIMILLQTDGKLPLIFTQDITRAMCFFFAAYLSLNVIMNFLSQSKKEKWVVGPLSLVTAICFWITAVLV